MWRNPRSFRLQAKKFSFSRFAIKTPRTHLLRTIPGLDEHDEQALAAGYLRHYADQAHLWTIDSPFFIAGQEKVAPRTATAFGENSEEVLCAAGYGESEIQALRAARVIG